MDDKLLIERRELVARISARSKTLREELNIKQDDLAQILGISKNTIVNVEREDDKCYSWPVVISIIILFAHTDVIKEILEGESPIEVVSKYAFIVKSKRNLLYNSTVSGFTNSIASITSAGEALLNLFSKKDK